MNASGVRSVTNQVASLKSSLEAISAHFEGLIHAGSYSPGWLTFGSPITVAVRKSAIDDVAYVAGLPVLGATIRLRSGGHDVDLAYANATLARSAFNSVVAWLSADSASDLAL